MSSHLQQCYEIGREFLLNYAMMHRWEKRKEKKTEE